ncbi:MAG TPA: 23S rRNA pseudouridine(1911/1915/1917) synthase RluD [Methylotenera sp.]|nr:23S rRNA pseudouridine(1911/1915/1917) synthase RluD [Methylotenera sp.]
MPQTQAQTNVVNPANILLNIPMDLGGQRLDVALQQLLPEHSRSRLQAWIKAGLVTLDGGATSAKAKIWGGEQVLINPPENVQENAFKPENIPLDIVFEDDSILVINKPAGLVVHPAAGNWSGTLLNALLHHAPQLNDVPRAGIVHRLDKDTSGLLVVAKTLEAQTSLVRQLQARTVKREYRAIVWGQLWRNGTINQPIGRHSHARTKMAISRTGKPAITHYEVLERFGVHTYLRCQLETGRTHQIRVHMQFLKAPMLGDPVYGIGNIIPHKLMTQTLRDAVSGFNRQALHAVKLGLVHPKTNAFMEWQIELADDMKALLEAMRHEDVPTDEEAFDFGVDENGLYVGEDDGDGEDEGFEDELLDDDEP